MSYVDNSAAERRAQEANHYHPTPWLRKWALAETGTFIQSPLRGDTVLRLPAERPTAAASCNHVSVTTDNLSRNVLHSGIAGGRQDDRRRLILKSYGSRLWSALMSFRNISTTTAHYTPDRSAASIPEDMAPPSQSQIPRITTANGTSGKHQRKCPTDNVKIPQVRISWTLAPLKFLKYGFIFLSAL